MTNSTKALTKDELIALLRKEKVNEFNEARPRPEVDLSRAKLCGAYLSGADLRWANLSRADLSEGDLSGADLRFANLSEADFHRTNLYGADLTGADLRGAYLYYISLSGVKLNWASFYGAHGLSDDQKKLIISQLKKSWE